MNVFFAIFGPLFLALVITGGYKMVQSDIRGEQILFCRKHNMELYKHQDRYVCKTFGVDSDIIELPALGLSG